MATRTFTTRSPAETWELARAVVAATPQRVVIALHGDLGSGKTCFVQGMAAALGIRRAVSSPTFTVINEYRGERPLYHIDLYRIAKADELETIGFHEYIEADGITAIEWAERAAKLLPPDTVHIAFETMSRASHRRLTVAANDKVVERLQSRRRERQ